MNKAQVEQLLGKTIVTEKIFVGDGTDFSAYSQAKAFLSQENVSMGSMQREAPIGLAYGDVGISKWRDLGADVRELDGVMLCDGRGFRNGTVIVCLIAKPEGDKIA